MATTITARHNQSLADLVIQACGSMEASMQFALDNNMAVSDVPVVGNRYVVSDAALALGDSSVLQYLAKRGNAKGPYLVGTLAAVPVVHRALLNDAGPALLNDDGSGLFNDN